MGPFDAELELRDIGDGAETASAEEDGVALPVRTFGDFKALVNITDIDTTTGSPLPTYLITIDVDSTAAFTDSPVEVARVVPTGTGTWEIPLSGAAIAQADPDAAAIRVALTASGVGASITYGCHLVPAA